MLYYDMNRKAFTLIELVMVLVIIGLLAAIIIPRFSTYRLTASLTATHANLHIIKKALKLYYIENGELPLTAAGTIAALRGDCSGCTVYLKDIPTAPCGNNISNHFGSGGSGGGWAYMITRPKDDTNSYSIELEPNCFYGDDDLVDAYNILFPDNRDFGSFTIP